LGAHRLGHAPRTGDTTRSAQRPWLSRWDRIRWPRRLPPPGRAGWPGLCRGRRRGGDVADEQIARSRTSYSGRPGADRPDIAAVRTGAGAVHGSPGDVTPPARRRVRA